MKSRIKNFKQYYQFLSSHTHAAVILDPNFTNDHSQLTAIFYINPLSTIIVPRKVEAHPDVAFKIQHYQIHDAEMCGLVKTIRYLQIASNGTINLLDASFHPCNEILSTYLFTSKAKNMVNKLLSTKLFEVDIDNRFGQTFRLKYKHTHVDSPFREIFIAISRDGTLSYDAVCKNEKHEKMKTDLNIVKALLRNTLETYITSDIAQRYSMGLN